MKAKNLHLLTVENAKTVKGEELGYLTGILYLTPADGGPDGLNLCPFATPGCRAACLNTAGRGRFDSVQAGRARKRAAFLADRAGFVASLRLEISALIRRAEREGMRAAVRLNGTSDIAWEKIAPELFKEFQGRARFYDYTKDARRAIAAAPPRTRGAWPRGYDITYSHGEGRGAMSRAVLAAGGRVAVVFSTRKGEELPARFMGARVVDGDRHDLRFFDRPGVVVGLRAKGDAKKDASGFVVDVQSIGEGD